MRGVKYYIDVEMLALSTQSKIFYQSLIMSQGLLLCNPLSLSFFFSITSSIPITSISEGQKVKMFTFVGFLVDAFIEIVEK